MPLQITLALPNPAGKDRPPHAGPTNGQVNNEWIEFANTGPAAIQLDGVAISHYTFDRNCQRIGEDELMRFANAIAVGTSVRVHTGQGDSWTENNVRHLYAGRGNYVWNNTCGDTAVLRRNGDWIDYAAYDPQPPEGGVLSRVPGTHRLAAVRSARTA